MIEQFMLIVGILQMVYAIILCNKIISLVDKANVKAWWTLFWLLCFFLFGYVGYFSRTLLVQEESVINSIITSSVFCFGATFVLIVFKVNRGSIQILSGTVKKANNINQSMNEDLHNTNRYIQSLEKSRVTLEKKNQSLKELLEDFYTLRLQMEKNTEDGSLKKENKAIRKKIDTIS